MNTKLTLRLEEHLIRSAKQYAERSGKSVSQLVSDYFAVLEGNSSEPATELTPRVRAMIGSLRGASATEADYRDHLERKHR